MAHDHEKRRTPRVPVQFKVRVETVRGTFNGMGRDISEGGMGVYIQKLPPLGSPVDLSFLLPQGDESIQITGEVMYHRRGGSGVRDDWMGVKFVRMDSASLAQIQKFVRLRADSAHAPPPPLPKS